MDLEKRLREAEERKKAAEQMLSPEAKKHLDALAKIERIEAEADEAEALVRKLDLAQRTDALLVRDPTMRLRGVSVFGCRDTFVVQRSGAAHQRWERSHASASKVANEERRAELSDAASVKYALDCIVSWRKADGSLVSDFTSEDTVALRGFLESKENSALVTTLVSELLALNGAVLEERKRAS